MSNELQGQRVAILAADGVERIELEQPRGALHGAGAQTELLSIHEGVIEARQKDLDDAATFDVEKVVSRASVDDYDALLLPGGTVNPDKLRMDTHAVEFVKAFVASGKPIAAICHGPWTLVEAGAVRGRRLTSWPSIRTDLRNAGADVVDEEVVVDGQLTTSRSPADLAAFCPAIVEQFAGAAERAHV
jgi:protease I